MAHGLTCIKCGYQETEHLHPELADPKKPPCKKFRDGIKHKRGCPKDDCTGDCDDATERKKRAKEDQQRAWDRIEH